MSKRERPIHIVEPDDENPGKWMITRGPNRDPVDEVYDLKETAESEAVTFQLREEAEYAEEVYLLHMINREIDGMFVDDLRILWKHISKTEWRTGT